jgi:3-phenylpropionate/trans-cinnamate dioxygenase ferredoxin reductase subunit
MPAESTYVIVGASLAGAKAAETLREEGFDERIVLIGAEPELPYERPALSKGYLLGKDERSSIYVHEASWYATRDVELRLSRAVTAIDRGARTVTAVPDGFGPAESETLRYDKLLLTTGASPRRLKVPGADLDGVLYLRTVADSDRLRAALRPGVRVVIAGAGWIGLETAAAASIAGCQVTVVESQPGALYGALGPELGGMFADLHRAHGVTFRFDEEVRELRGSGDHVTGAVTSAGTELPADVVIVGIGVVPNDELAAQAGLDVDNGIVADAALRTSDPDILAAGDVASSFRPLYGRRVRVEHWHNALAGGPAAARSMAGESVTYDPVPYFYSDQYDLSMETAGLPFPGTYDQVVYRGDRAGLEFIAFWLQSGTVVAGMNVNVWDVTDDIQALIRSGRKVDLTRLTDPSIPLTDV